MTIIHADRQGVTNYDNVKQLSLSDRFIHATYVDGTDKIIGVYPDADHAKNAYYGMLAHLFPEKVAVENDMVYRSMYNNPNVFYLPEV